jgi:uroporphyrin-III C-methyltransferase/precorrin-2 dehydrogenase/sirohydrochlorin ferrochelatase/uroporphyrin-III C-methyltransferase
MKQSACVYLVGTGPGDPDLLTVKAQRLLQTADVVIYDRLVSDEILQQISPGVARIYVGKCSGSHVLKQDEINRLLVSLATGKRTVVRLKGGDPFIFGRGGEEAEYLAHQGVRFEIVPGVTAASACSTYAGIPLTHRGLAHGVQFVTGHWRDDQPLELDWHRLADPDQTLAIYMGLANLSHICQRLINAGLAAATPAAVIENGTTQKQRSLITTLSALPDRVRENEMRPPVLVVIGRVVTMADRLNWFKPAIVGKESRAQDDHTLGA